MGWGLELLCALYSPRPQTSASGVCAAIGGLHEELDVCEVPGCAVI
jgi:hypothetical protein